MENLDELIRFYTERRDVQAAEINSQEEIVKKLKEELSSIMEQRSTAQNSYRMRQAQLNGEASEESDLDAVTNAVSDIVSNFGVGLVEYDSARSC